MFFYVKDGKLINLPKFNLDDISDYDRFCDFVERYGYEIPDTKKERDRILEWYKYTKHTTFPDEETEYINETAKSILLYKKLRGEIMKEDSNLNFFKKKLDSGEIYYYTHRDDIPEEAIELCNKVAKQISWAVSRRDKPTPIAKMPIMFPIKGEITDSTVKKAVEQYKFYTKQQSNYELRKTEQLELAATNPEDAYELRLIENVKIARELGDLSENSEYSDALERLTLYRQIKIDQGQSYGIVVIDDEEEFELVDNVVRKGQISMKTFVQRYKEGLDQWDTNIPEKFKTMFDEVSDEDTKRRKEALEKARAIKPIPFNWKKYTPEYNKGLYFVLRFFVNSDTYDVKTKSYVRVQEGSEEAGDIATCLINNDIIAPKKVLGFKQLMSTFTEVFGKAYPVLAATWIDTSGKKKYFGNTDMKISMVQKYHNTRFPGQIKYIYIVDEYNDPSEEIKSNSNPCEIIFVEHKMFDENKELKFKRISKERYLERTVSPYVSAMMKKGMLDEYRDAYHTSDIIAEEEYASFIIEHNIDCSRFPISKSLNYSYRPGQLVYGGCPLYETMSSPIPRSDVEMDIEYIKYIKEHFEVLMESGDDVSAYNFLNMFKDYEPEVEETHLPDEYTPSIKPMRDLDIDWEHTSISGYVNPRGSSRGYVKRDIEDMVISNIEKKNRIEKAKLSNNVKGVKKNV